jgi:ATP-dependent DNA helicase PIF1
MTVSNLDINPKFAQALHLLEDSNRHIFITGKAGTGKSTLLNHFRATTGRKHVVLAPTGIAAVNIEGETIHSFFGFHPGITPHEARKEAQNKRDISIFNELELIVIDEISMVRADLMDSVDAFLRTIRRNGSPFGGVQMVFIGDLYQLPPVLTQEEKELFLSIYDSPYFFDSIVLRELFSDMYDLNLKFIELDQIYRQNDEAFIELLNKIRNRTLDFTVIKQLNQRHLLKFKETDEHIYLVTTNRQADEINKKKLQALKGHPMKFKGTVAGEFDAKGLPTEQELTLKLDTRVMFVKNDPEGRWINGTLGTVTAFVGRGLTTLVKVQIDGGSLLEVEPVTWGSYRSTLDPATKNIEREEIGTFTQVPLKLAWAFTIHKSQGKTFEKVIIDIGNGAFAHGQIYVALSRCKTFEGLILKKPIRSFDIRMDQRVAQFMQALQSQIE